MHTIKSTNFGIYDKTKSTTISSLYVCLVNTKVKYHLVETPRKFTIAKLSIRKLGSSSVSHLHQYWIFIIISTDEDPGLRIEGFAMIKLRGVSTKVYFLKSATSY